MKQEKDKELLLKDLSARLPYRTIIQVNDWVLLDKELKVGHISRLINENLKLKPYLRPLSSMTEEEKEQIRDFWIDADVKTHATQLIDFYNKYHFDYRGLIEKGLALEAPEGIY